LAALAASSQFECGVVLDIRGRPVWVRRRLEADSTVLQVLAEGGKITTKLVGAEPVQRGLERSIGLRSLSTFDRVHLGRVTPPPRHVEPKPPPRDDPGPADPLDALLGRSGPDASESTSAAADLLGEVGALDREEGGGGVGTPPFELPAERSEPVDPREVKRLRSEYRRAQQVERVEEQIARLREALYEVEDALKPQIADSPELRKLRNKLTLSPEIEVAPDEREALANSESMQRDLERRESSIKARLERLRKTAFGLRALLVNPAFALGTALALVCTVTSLVGGPGLRIIALGNVICLAGTLTGLLQYLRERDTHADQRQERSELEKALVAVDGDRRRFERKLAAVRRKHRVESIDDLNQLEQKRRDIEAEIERLEASARDEAGAPDGRDLEAEKRELEAQIARLEAEKDVMGEAPLTSYQIAQEMNRLGVSVEEEPASIETDPFDADEEGAPPSPFPMLRSVAEELGQQEAGELRSESRELWARLVQALVGRDVPLPRVALPQASDFLGIRLSSERDPWEQMTAPQRRLSVEALLLSLLLRSIGRVRPSPPPFVMRLDPFGHLPTEHAATLRDVYGKLSSRLQIILIETADPGAS
jgi:hypothetical protein